MSARWRLGLLLVTALVAAGWIYHWLNPSDVRRVRRVLDGAVAACTWAPGAGALQKLAAANRLADLCAPDVEVLLDFRGARGLQGVDGVREALLAARTRVESLAVEMGQCEITVGPGPGEAFAQAVFTVRTPEDPEPWLQELRIRFVRLESGWRIARVEPVRGFGG